METNRIERSSFLRRNLDHIVYAAFMAPMAIVTCSTIQEKYGDNPTRFLEAGILAGGMFVVGTAGYYLHRHYHNQNETE